jgi:Mor family transcriptional regulator
MDKKTLKDVVLNNPGKVVSPFDGLLGLDAYDAVCALLDFYGGSTVYIPTKRNVFRKCIESAVRREFNGQNFRDLLVKYGYSESHMRKILRSG